MRTASAPQFHITRKHCVSVHQVPGPFRAPESPLSQVAQKNSQPYTTLSKDALQGEHSGKTGQVDGAGHPEKEVPE